jgi:hypothetical protein
MRRFRSVVSALLALPPLVTACADGPADTADVLVTDSAGVTTVRSTAADDTPLTFVADRTLTLGGRDTPEESFFQVGSANVGTDARGHLYVLDRSIYQVQVFDSTGRHVRTMGRQGGGPGELQFPFALAVAEDGATWVADIGRRALVRWGPEGELLEPAPLPALYRGGAVRALPEGLAYTTRDAQWHALAVADASDPDAEAAELLRLPLAETRALELKSCGMSFSGMEPIFSPYPTWTTSGSHVAVARNPEYRVDIYTGGRLVRSIRRDLPPRPATADLAEASLGDGMRVGTSDGERICDPAEVVEQQGFAPWLPTLGVLALAPDGTLWARRYEVGDAPGPIDVFDPDGRYVGTLPATAPFPIGFLPDGRILVSEIDEVDVQRLVVTRLALEPSA